MNKILLEELKEATKAIVELLQKKGNPHLQITITQTSVKIVEEQMGIPLNFKD